MGIRERVEDAELLWRDGRTEGALLAAVVAVAATARRKYPEAPDRAGFERLLRDARSWRLSLEFRGSSLPVEELLYKWFRCELVHSGGLPVDIHLVPAQPAGELSALAGVAPSHELHLSETWLHHLLDIVVYEPINADLFPVRVASRLPRKEHGPRLPAEDRPSPGSRHVRTPGGRTRLFLARAVAQRPTSSIPRHIGMPHNPH